MILWRTIAPRLTVAFLEGVVAILCMLPVVGNTLTTLDALDISPDVTVDLSGTIVADEDVG